MDLTIPRLGQAKIASPLRLSTTIGDLVANFVPDSARVLHDISLDESTPCPSGSADPPLSFERAGPRERIYFDPSKLRVGVVTCGGLCPGVNTVIRTLVIELSDRYGVHQITGFRYGFAGLVPEHGYPVLELNPNLVDDIHHDGGSILGTSRGPQDIESMVDTLERMGISLFFIIGGDGTLRGAQAIYEEITRRRLKIAIVGIPKTIDNDVLLVERTFGFETAVSIAIEAIRSAHTEAKSTENGVGLVRLMGRHSGYIAASAALAEPDVNLVLIPEIPFALDGPGGVLDWLEARLRQSDHAVIVVAEGAGQDLLRDADRLVKRDASGNVKLADIGLFLRDAIDQALQKRGVPHSLKYIDPSYLIRSAPANPNDSLFASNLARSAMHAGMSGRTGMLVGLWHGAFTHVPIREA
ncbi:ATP-dependent 6-phosphofructokinase, partial [Candidatus Bipolaricaulota bacterium]|nr:ATP-dependent 6-phosphofructokinase [Candidatus Bipolaricaulota bacterium]